MPPTATIRPVAVALAAAAIELGLGSALRASAADLAASGASPDGRVAAVLTIAATGTGLLGWTAWCGTLLVAGQQAWHRSRRPTGRWLRLAAATLGLATGLAGTAPGLAAEPPSAGCEPDRLSARLAGLPLPTLPGPIGAVGAVATARRGAPYLVRPGDSLWSIADRRWRHWYAANRDVIGPDPDLILPGQRLRPPAPGSASASASTSGKADR